MARRRGCSASIETTRDGSSIRAAAAGPDRSRPVPSASSRGWTSMRTGISTCSSHSATGRTRSSETTAGCSRTWRRRWVSPIRERPSARSGSTPTRTATSTCTSPTWTATRTASFAMTAADSPTSRRPAGLEWGGRAPRDVANGTVRPCAADVDGDGRLDLFMANYGPNGLFLNRGAGRFEDVSKAWGVAIDGRYDACAFADIDHDGRLDLYVNGTVTGGTSYRDYLFRGGRRRLRRRHAGQSAGPARRSRRAVGRRRWRRRSGSRAHRCARPTVCTGC